jgi:membrane associated rhomboid family serine protease/Zn-finger nucleic acid-binding protein
VERETVNALWQEAKSGACPRHRECPACDAQMFEVPLPIEQGALPIDVCTRCHIVWFDPHEYAVLPKLEVGADEDEPLPMAARQALAETRVRLHRETAASEDWGEIIPDEGWKTIPGVLGMPVEMDAPPLRSAAWTTWSLAIVIIAISVLGFMDLENAVENFGLIPAAAGRLYGLTYLSSFFLHGGIMHLLGNLYFFIVFGDNVEDFLGRGRYIGLILLATLAGDVAHILGDPRSEIPCIGASGGISGIMAFYAFRFPRAKIGIMYRGWVYLRWMRFPAWVMFLFWVLLQGIGVTQQLAGLTSVSSLAHLGGAAVGVGFWAASRGPVNWRYG